MLHAMKQSVHDLLQRPLVRYILVGGTVYVVELAIIFGLQLRGLSAVVAVGISYIVGTMLAFTLQKLFTFRDKRMHRKVVGLQLLAMAGLVIFNFLFSIALTALMQHTLPAVVVRTGAILITTLWNFYLYRTAIFKNGAADEPAVF